MFRRSLFVLCIGFSLLASGCAVYMAAHQPSQKNMGLLTAGVPRSNIIAEFGAPVTSEEKDGLKVDIYRFRQGYSQGAKAARAVTHGAADVLTLGLWEVIGTPTEATFNGKDVAVKITYDSEDKIKEVVYLSSK